MFVFGFKHTGVLIFVGGNEVGYPRLGRAMCECWELGVGIQGGIAVEDQPVVLSNEQLDTVMLAVLLISAPTSGMQEERPSVI